MTRISWKWGRWQHHVDYTRFRYNKFKLRSDIVIPEGNNEFGMKFVNLKGDNNGRNAESGGIGEADMDA